MYYMNRTEELEKFYDEIKDKFKVFLNLNNIEKIEIYSVEEMKEINEIDKRSYENYYQEQIERYRENSFKDENDYDYDEEYDEYDENWDEPYNEDTKPFGQKLIEFFVNNKSLYILHEWEIFYYNFRKFERYEC